MVKELTRCDWCRIHVTCVEHGDFVKREGESGHDWVCRCCLEKRAEAVAKLGNQQAQEEKARKAKEEEVEASGLREECPKCVPGNP